MGSTDPTIPSDTVSDDSDLVPSLAQLAAAIPLQSTRHLIATQLARGATPDGVTGGVAAWLASVIDWRDAGVPSGALGPTGQLLLRDAVRVLVDAVERSRRPGTARLPRPAPARAVPPRRPPPPPNVTTAEPMAMPPDPADER